MATAPELLKRAAEIMEERGKQYDKPDGERSMAKTVAAFNTITGEDLTEQEGWLFMQVLKDVRQWQTPNKAHPDSLEDCIAYAALKAEAFIYSKAKDAPQFPALIDDVNDGWIDWTSEDMPVNPDTYVDCTFRNGVTSFNRKARTLEWFISGHAGDIVKYRIHKEDK